MKSELLLLGFMDSQLEKTCGSLVLYIVTAVKLLYAQKCKHA